MNYYINVAKDWFSPGYFYAIHYGSWPGPYLTRIFYTYDALLKELRDEV